MIDDGHDYLNGLLPEELIVRFEDASAAVDHHMGIMLACLARMQACTPEQLDECKKIKKEVAGKVNEQ